METKYALIVVFVCVVTPIAFGLFVWPSSDVEVSEWNTSPNNQINITESLAVTDVPNTSPYSGANNNLFLFNNTMIYMAEPVTRTDTVTPFEYFVPYSTGSAVPEEKDMPSGTVITPASNIWTHFYNVASQEIPDPDNISMIFWSSTPGGSLYFIYEDQTYHGIMLFKNGRAQLYEPSTGAIADVTEHSFTYVRSGFTLLQYYGKAVFEPYVDLTDGFHFDSTGSGLPYTWVNGYVNHTITLIIKPEKNTMHTMDINGRTLGVNWNYSNMWEIIGAGSNAVLGDADTYPYLLFLIDADNNRGTVYGLTGMSGFTDLYTNHLGNSLSFEYTGGPFTSVQFYMGDFDYYVAGTTIESGTTKAIKDATFTPRNYYADDEWTVVLKNPAVIGTSIQFATSGQTYDYPISGGRISVTFTGDEEPTELLLRDMTIAHIKNPDNTYSTYINGKQIDINIQSIGLMGVWDTAVYVNDVAWTTHHDYFWDTTSFGLDMTSFCTVGLVTSILAFLFFGFVMTKLGGSDLLAMIASIGCGAFYLVLLMA